ncbi:MAG: hypothetical protein ABWY63_14185 [Hyphomicrobiaceae bacterium]
MSKVLINQMTNRAGTFAPTIYRSSFIHQYIRYNQQTNSVQQSYNFSSLLDVGPGQQWVNFSTSMTDGAYPTLAFGRRIANYNHCGAQMDNRTALKCLSTYVENNAVTDTYEFHGMAAGLPA